MDEFFLSQSYRSLIGQTESSPLSTHIRPISRVTRCGINPRRNPRTQIHQIYRNNLHSLIRRLKHSLEQLWAFITILTIQRIDFVVWTRVSSYYSIFIS